MRRLRLRAAGWWTTAGRLSARRRLATIGWVAGPDSPAPPAGDGRAVAGPELIQSFANTLTAEPGTDLLGTRELAAEWLRQAGLLSAGAGVTGSEHGALLRLRDSMRDMLAAHTDGREDDAAAARLTRALADGRLVLTINPASTVGLASAARASYSSVVAAIAVAVAQSAATGEWLGLKACDAAGCGQAFLDGAAPGGRRCPAHGQ